MFNALLIVQFSIALLLLLSVLIQRTSKQSLGDFDSSNSDSYNNKFIIRVTWVLIVLFFINSIILGNIASRSSAAKDIVKSDVIESKTGDITKKQ